MVYIIYIMYKYIENFILKHKLEIDSNDVGNVGLRETKAKPYIQREASIDRTL